MSANPWMTANIDDILFPPETWRQGLVHRRAKSALAAELIELDADHAEQAREDFEAVLPLLESPIEQVALIHMLGRSYSPVTDRQRVFARAMNSLPEEWPECSQLSLCRKWT